MATRTTNYDLYKPDATDNFSDFREEFNENMDIIDQNLGGGGGGGGHTIYDENGSAMTQRTGLEFTGNVQVTDDSVNNKTIVDILGGGGSGTVNVYGAFIDTTRILASGTYSSSNPLIYTATEDCFADIAFISSDGNKNVYGYIDGVQIDRLFNNSGIVVSNEIYPLRRGQTLRVETTRPDNDSPYAIYGIAQGTNGIFAPVIYSDTERVIGVWRDNKPLYQKTFIITPTSSSFTIDVSSLNIDKLVKREGSLNRQASASMLQQKAIEYRTESPGNASYGIIAELRNTNIQISIEGYTYSEITEIRLTIQYTKTTDTAGSGNWNTDGVPTHHYSTSEQVIGTWYNGKTIYEKTYEFSTALLVEYSSWSNTSIDSSNIQTIIDARAWHSDGTSYGTIMADPTRSSHTLVGLQTTRNGSQANVKVLTIQYTKTTD